MVLAVVLALGAYAYVAIPKEANPEVPFPSSTSRPASTASARGTPSAFLIEPMEQEFGAITGLERMESFASEGSARVALEFHSGWRHRGRRLPRHPRGGWTASRASCPTDAYDLTVTEIKHRALSGRHGDPFGAGARAGR